MSRHVLATGALTPDQMRQFNFHVRHTRGELLFARCWLLVEGETEMTLLPEVARLRNMNLERLGIRCVPYRNSDIDTMIKAANSLGIRWCVLADNDMQGESDRKKVRASLNGLPEAEILHMMPQTDIEQYLCACGYASVYEAFLSHQSRKNITVQPGHPEYWRQMVKAISFSKPAAAVTIVGMMATGGGDVPPILEAVLRSAERQAEEG